MQAKLPDAKSFVEWCTHGTAGKPGLVTPQTPLTTKLRLDSNGVYRRVFYHVPNTGPHRCKRAQRAVKFEGSSQLHSVVDIGKPDVIMKRERSCHRCESCLGGNPSRKYFADGGESNCPNSEICGHSERQSVQVVNQPTTSLARAMRSGDKVAHSQMVGEAAVDMVVCIILNSGKGRDYEPWMLCKVTAATSAATSADVEEASTLGFTVREGANVLRLAKYEPYEPGSRRFALTNVTVIAPTSALVRHKLETNGLETVRKARVDGSAAANGKRTLTGGAFELKEGDHRAILQLIDAEHVGTFIAERIVAHRSCDEQIEHWTFPFCCTRMGVAQCAVYDPQDHDPIEAGRRVSSQMEGLGCRW